MLVSPALGQERSGWVPPDKELWDSMVRALEDVPMSKGSHFSIDQILINVLREAQIREARAKMAKPVEQKP